MSWTKRTAAGDPISDIIGVHIGDLEIGCEKDLDIGFSLNPINEVGNFLDDIQKTLAKATHDEIEYQKKLNPVQKKARMAFLEARAADIRSKGKKSLLQKVLRTAKNVTRPTRKLINRTPGLGDAAKFVTQRANLMLTAPRLAYGAAKGFTKGGFKGAARGLKDEAQVTKREARRLIQNPIVRYGTKGAALLFPPMVTVAGAVEAANQAIAAIQGKDPIKAALALTTIANTVAMANGGNTDALRAIKTIQAVKDKAIPKEVTNMLSKVAPKFSLPKGVTKPKALAAANALLKAAKGAGSASAAKAAKATIKNTITSFKKDPSPKNKAAITVLGAVHRAQKVAKTKAKVMAKGSFRKAVRAAKGKSYSNSYLVDSRGNVLKGNFAAR